MTGPGQDGPQQQEHSLLTDPAFAKLTDLKHAECCTNSACTYQSCGQMKVLLRHVNTCFEKRCEYPDCDLASILLYHYFDNGHRDPRCPLCKKQEILLRLHPGKGPRYEEVEEKDEKNEEEDQEIDLAEKKMARAVQVMRATPMRRPNRTVVAVTRPDPKRGAMLDLIHANKCTKKGCDMPNCAGNKMLLDHALDCYNWKDRQDCYYPGCVEGRKLMKHYRSCYPRDRTCPLCDTKKVNLDGKDRLSTMPALVLRKIFMGCYGDNWTLNRLERVNRRLRSFMQDEKELRGLYVKDPYDSLIIEQVGDCAISFHFKQNNPDDSGLFYVLPTVTGVEGRRIPYRLFSTNSNAKKIIKQEYPRLSMTAVPLRIPEQFYVELSLALVKHDFMSIELRSIMIDNDFFEFFNSRFADIFCTVRALTYCNVQFVPDEVIDAVGLDDFLSVLDVRETKHLCEERVGRKRDCWGVLKVAPGCSCMRFPVLEEARAPTKRSLFDEPYYACSYSLSQIK